jgi:hypothetical protein
MSDCHQRGETRIHWSSRADGLEESTWFRPGYNCPARGPRSHGVHGMEISWHLRGPAGGVWLTMFTDWIPGERTPGHGLSPSGRNENWSRYPDGGGLGYHARVPQYEGQTVDREDCDIIGGPCYSDMSFGGADEPVKRFVVDGEQAIWDVLESHYAELRASWDEAQSR